MINDIHIYDNIISKENQDKLETYFLSKDLNWNVGNNTSYLNVEFPQRVITSEDGIPDDIRSIILDIEKNVVSNLNTTILENYRYKINLLKSEDYSKSRNENDGIHIDRNQHHISMVYYINDSEGDTKFYQLLEGERKDIIRYISQKEYHRFSEFKSIPPKKGTVVVFNGLIPHRSSYPKTGNRCIINFNTVIKSKPKLLF